MTSTRAKKLWLLFILLVGSLVGLKAYLVHDRQVRFERFVKEEEQQRARWRIINERIQKLESFRASQQRVRETLADLGPFNVHDVPDPRLLGLTFEDPSHEWRFELFFYQTGLIGHGSTALTPQAFSDWQGYSFARARFWLVRVNGLLWAALVILLFNWPSKRSAFVHFTFALAALHLSLALVSGDPKRFVEFNRNVFGFAIAILITAISGLVFVPKPKTDFPACPQCGYNLTGNQSGVCPECEAAVPGAQVPVQAARLGEMVE